MTKQEGGIAPNIAYTLALLGGHPMLMGTVGIDFEDYRNAWKVAMWIQICTGDQGRVHCIIFANTDLDNAQIASFYSGAMARAAEISLHKMEADKPDFVVVSHNDPKANAAV